MFHNFYLSFFIIVISLSYINGDCPKIISRAEWDANNPKQKTPLKINPAPYVVIHHTEGPSCNTIQKCKTVVKGIQNYHMINRGWDDIGYNFLIGGDGNVYEGRGWDLSGAHVPAYNKISVGISLIGSFMDKLPPSNQLEALKNLINCSKKNNKIISNYHLIGHRQGSQTDCPGDDLFSEISKWSHFDSNPSPLKKI